MTIVDINNTEVAENTEIKEINLQPIKATVGFVGWACTQYVIDRPLFMLMKASFGILPPKYKFFSKIATIIGVALITNFIANKVSDDLEETVDKIEKSINDIIKKSREENEEEEATE